MKIVVEISSVCPLGHKDCIVVPYALQPLIYCMICGKEYLPIILNVSEKEVV